MPILLAMLLHVSATSVQFYGDRFVLEAQGSVRVQAGAATMRGDAFSMDLKLNRFVLAGHVRIESPAGRQSGAAVAYFFDFDRIYFLPLDGGPDRWTITGGDFAHPIKGRRMPADAFAFPQTDDARADIVGDAATIGTRSFVRFAGPIPHVVNFSNDPHLAQNSLSGANLDGTWNFAGGAWTLSAVHARYDSLNHAYLAFEQHLSGKNGYAVFSVNPLTHSSRAFNIIASQRPSERFQIHTFLQLQRGSRYDAVQLTQAFARSSLQLTHRPGQFELESRSFTNRIGRLPLYESLVYDLAYGSEGARGVQRSVALDLRVPSLKIGSANFNADLLTSFVTPSTQAGATLSRSFGRHVLAFAGYDVQNGGYQTGFAGPATLRTASLNVTYSNGGNFSAWLLARKHTDFPQPGSARFTIPPLDVLGQQPKAAYPGEAPYDLTADVRFRAGSHMTIDLRRTYSFHFQNRGWSPQFVLQVTP